MGEGREAQREEREKSGEVVAVAMAAGGRSSSASRARADGRYLIRADEPGMKADGGIAQSTRQHGSENREGVRDTTCLCIFATGLFRYQIRDPKLVE